ncbi:DUF1345 domain-containing protein [Arthrobacter bambusae]|uniref:DUF1345 domain-containing protein n=1 Tax=Arthrobacter bambusae TaxID=1338426 RepID=UPI00278742D1|nr:DUF1345 domain-containing protein [Arthrobacter bambusae]MDQ0029903.1 putative membrane protein [Arthrobacter bambusae]MDQ0097579.1 putative membrane protein [Arthrobacter bambusae]
MENRAYGSRIYRASTRLVVMVVLGVAAGFATAAAGAPALGPTVGWGVASCVYLLMVWATIGRMDAEQTALHATRQDPSRAVANVLVLVAGVASMGAVAVMLLEIGSVQGSERDLIVLLALVVLALSGLLVHTLYTLRYAHLYYEGVDGGIGFNQERPPCYVDFAYLAFTIGMTFQVSDTDLQTSEIRGIALRQALLSYLFGVVVLATTINLVSGLIH